MNPLISELLDRADNFDPSATRSEYDTHSPVWRLYLDLYELDAVKLKSMVDKHHDDEDGAKYAMRQSLAAAVNLVPTIVNLTRNYIFSKTPKIEVKDESLAAFVNNCDGRGTWLGDWIRNHALPLSQILGFVDVLVQNPNTDRNMLTRADLSDAKVTPNVVAFTPLDRVSWSCRTDGSYAWARFKDNGDESTNPFEPPTQTDAYVTLSEPVGDAPSSFWVRSVWQDERYVHDGDLCPTRRVPIATLYHQQSIDPDLRHHGISKIAMIAVLTKKIIQVLSWTDEDVLANLAIYCMPSKNGQKPVGDDGRPVVSSMSAFSVLWFDRDSSQPPMVLQGNVSHIEVKLKLVELLLREIMRVANLMAVSGDAKASQSGVQSVVERNELFRELSDTAAAMESFTLDLLALAKSWITGEDVDVATLTETDSPTVSFNRGPYTVEPLLALIEQTERVVDMMRDLSPTTVEAGLKQVARAFIIGDDNAMNDAMKELDGSGERSNTPPVVSDADRQGTPDQIAESPDEENAA